MQAWVGSRLLPTDALVRSAVVANYSQGTESETLSHRAVHSQSGFQTADIKLPVEILPKQRHPLVGRFAIVGSDNRYCGLNNNRTAGVVTSFGGGHGRKVSQVCGVQVDATADFWWISAALNAAWAHTYGYDHLLYCVTACAHVDSGELRWTAWCKVVIMADALEQYDSLLFMDSDAYWKQPNMSITAGLIKPFTGATWIAHEKLAASQAVPAAYFGCNSPWEDCGYKWNSSAVNAGNGSANSGVVLLRNTPRARLILREWWHASNGRAKQHAWRRPGSCSDQAGLWRLWSARPDLAASMRVFRDEDIPATVHTKERRARCMRVVATAKNQKRSPIQHFTSISPSYRKRKFVDAWQRGAASHPASWCVLRIELNATAVASHLFGHIRGNTRRKSTLWGHNEYTARG